MGNGPVEGAITRTLKHRKGNYSKTHLIFILFFFLIFAEKHHATISEHNLADPILDLKLKVLEVRFCYVIIQRCFDRIFFCQIHLQSPIR